MGWPAEEEHKEWLKCISEDKGMYKSRTCMSNKAGRREDMTSYSTHIDSVR